MWDTYLKEATCQTLDLFINSTALFWALAEVWILLFLIRAISTGLGNPPKTQRYGGAFILCAVILSAIAFSGEQIAGQVFDFHYGLKRHFYRNAQWHFFCTLWVVLEGAIMIYVWQIYLMLVRSCRADDHGSRVKRLSGIYPHLAVLVLVGSIVLFFTLYEYHTFSLLGPTGIDALALDRISDFYLNICGVVWIIFDGGVAVLGYKIYRLIHSLQINPTFAETTLE